MKHQTQLYIANKLVDCSETLSLPITYSLEDLSNPTVVKNSVSKTITIPATKRNNKIFGEIWRNDRMQHYEEWTGNPQLNGINYDPSKRVDFSIYVNGEVVESGYCQLNDVTINNEIKNYSITLYGGLGDFFYGLKYNEDGSTKTLADLHYHIEKDGTLLPEEEEMNFTINKEFIDECYSKDWSVEGNKLTDVITFMPAYNGIYERFDASHCLINTESTVFPKNTFVDGKEYTTRNGYALASLSKEYTEWEMKDLRSYQQRPAIKLSKLVEAICSNSGYTVTLDPTFFNEHNPYWSKAFIALPLLGTTTEDAETSVVASMSSSSVTIDTLFPHSTTTISVEGDHITTEDGAIDLSYYPTAATIDLDVDFSLRAYAISQAERLYISTKKRIGREVYKTYNQAISAQVIAYEADTDAILGYSDLYYFSNASTPDTWIDYTPRTDASAVWINGSFKKSSGSYVFTTNTGDDTMRLSLKKVPRADKMRIVLYVDWQKNDAECVYNLYEGQIIGPADNGIVATETLTTVAGDVFTLSTESPILSGTTVTKATLLKTESSPADYLLSYSKLFGLYYTKDIIAKHITIHSRKTYFNSTIHNWDDRIDRSKNITITPILFDKKWYTMDLNTPESYAASKYKSKYALTYGQKRLNTGYNFNSDSIHLYDGNIYQGAVTMIDSDKYFRSFIGKNGREVPAFMVDNITYTLYKGEEATDLSLYGANYIDTTRTRDWTSMGKDLFAKQCFFSLNGDTRGLEEITSSLVFYNGTVNTGSINFWITDDLREMSSMNDGEMCFLYTNSEYGQDGKRIAIKRNSLPQFISYVTSSNNSVSYSFDFGLPKEVYHNYAYNDNSTLYNLFWKDFYADQLSIDTRKVTCYVHLDDLKVNSEMMRDFYYFDNSYWLLNKIDSYDVNSIATVRCEFIRVQDIEHYRSMVSFEPAVSVKVLDGDDEVSLVPPQGGTYTISINGLTNPSIEETLDVIVIQDPIIRIEPNPLDQERDVQIVIRHNGGMYIHTIKQEAM